MARCRIYTLIYAYLIFHGQLKIKGLKRFLNVRMQHVAQYDELNLT